MIEAVHMADLERLLALKTESNKNLQIGYAILLDIVKRLPRPRAYLLKPPCGEDEAEQAWWEFETDIVSVMLTTQQISVLESETFGVLIRYCLPFAKYLDVPDPLWAPLAVTGNIDQVWMPRRGMLSKRYVAACKLAIKHTIGIRFWRPRKRA